MPKADLYLLSGQKSGQISLPGQIFAAKTNSTLVAQAVRVYLANQRKARPKTKARSEVSGSRRKIWRQKGTGRARHGDRYAPIFVGGGVAHGPTGQENHQLKLSQKMRRQALFSALTSKFRSEQIIIIKGLAKIEPQTKKMSELLQKIAPRSKKILLVLPQKVENVLRAAGNLKNTQTAQAKLLNTYRVLNGGQLIFMVESLPVLEETFLAKKSPSQQIKAKKRK